MKEFLKLLKVNESTISMLMGVVVLVVIGYFGIGLLRQSDEGEIILPVGTEEEQVSGSHTVKAGEDLWKIAELYYDDGYKWVDIAEENELSDPSVITEGMKLKLPALTEDELIEEETVTETETQTQEEIEPSLVAENTTEETEISELVENINDEGKYVVEKGDHLWKIAENHYNDGYMWVEIAQANKLDNPDIIHTGNVLILPAK